MRIVYQHPICLSAIILVFCFSTLALGGEKSSALDDPTLFCDGCFALVSELEKDMSGSAASGLNLKTRIENSLSGVCSTERLRAYKFSPPTQVKTCSAILDAFPHLLRSVLREQFRGGRLSSVEDLTQLFCIQGTKACHNREIPTLQQRKEREKSKQMINQEL